jgi:hypothetical protein
VFVAHSTNAGASFGANVRVDDYPDFERIDERPTLAVDRDGSVHVAWTDLRAREADTNVFYAKSTTLGQSFGPNVQVDDSRMGFDADTATPTNQWHPSIAVDNGHVFVAWQDNRLGNDDVFFTTSVNAGASFGSSERVDDTGAGSSEQTRPRLAIAGHGARRMCYVAWEDTRKGDRDIYAAARACGN